MSVWSIPYAHCPLPVAHCSCSAVVPVQFSQPREPRPRPLVNILLELAFIGAVYHRRSLYHHSFKGTHLGIHIERGKSKQLDTLVSSLEFHLAVYLISHATSHPHSATFEPTLIHSYTLTHLEKTNRPPIHSDSTVLLCSFCSIANAGLASSSNSSLYY